MASTIHTMSILLRQMVMRDSGESTVGPELLSGVQGSWVVAGTCLFRKFPLAVDEGSELFPGESGSSQELLLGSSPPNAVTFLNQCPRGALSVALLWTSSSVVVSLVAVWLFGMIVGLCVFSVGPVGVAEVDAEDVRFSGGLSTGATFGSITSSSVGGSSCTSLKVMECGTAPRACSLSFRPSAGSASPDEEEREVREER